MPDTIVALATPVGRAGVAVIRISGPSTHRIARYFLQKEVTPRQAYFTRFVDAQSALIDEGLLLYFQQPNSFTGEDVVELQGHGNPLLTDRLIKTIIDLGARMARPGEFSERAFLNGKMDLTQAEAVADLISASTDFATRSALLSLQGVFRNKIKSLLETLIHLRMYVEASIDFPEEDVALLQSYQITQQLKTLCDHIDILTKETQCGVRLQEGFHVVLAGEPNAGKSSLLNRLMGDDRAMVSDIPGTTRDVLQSEIQISGVPFYFFDTAGIRESNDVLEQEGIRRAHVAIEKSDMVLWLADATSTPLSEVPLLIKKIKNNFPNKKILLCRNKIDSTNDLPELLLFDKNICLQLSVKTGEGFDALLSYLVAQTGITPNEGVFMARRRHLDALQQTSDAIMRGIDQWDQHFSIECLAEELRLAQQYLSEITGEYTTDDLLGEIFSSFCIGK